MKKLFLTTIFASLVSILSAQDSTFTVQGIFSNSATSNSPLSVKVNMKSDNVIISLYEYGDSKAFIEGEGRITASLEDGTIVNSVAVAAKGSVSGLRYSTVTLPIVTLGNNKSSTGVTKIPCYVKDGKIILEKSKAYFVYDNPSWSYYSYVYDESTGHSPAPMTKKLFTDWKTMVDNELLNPKYQNLSIKDLSSISFDDLVLLNIPLNVSISAKDFESGGNGKYFFYLNK